MMASPAVHPTGALTEDVTRAVLNRKPTAAAPAAPGSARCHCIVLAFAGLPARWMPMAPTRGPAKLVEP